jgi:DNA-binding transcriptional LysR family regulator
MPLDLERKPRLVSDDILFMRKAVVGGLGLGFLPRFLVRKHTTSTPKPTRRFLAD